MQPPTLTNLSEITKRLLSRRKMGRSQLTKTTKMPAKIVVIKNFEQISFKILQQKLPEFITKSIDFCFESDTKEAN